MTALGERYYRLGLFAAKNRELHLAADFARKARLFDPAHENAAKLLGLCLYERGDLAAAREILTSFPELAGAAEEADTRQKSGFDQIRQLTRQGKWRKAAGVAAEIPHQSPRVLCVQGCLYAKGKRYGAAAKAFAAALEKDPGNRLAARGLQETARRKWFWEIQIR